MPKIPYSDYSPQVTPNPGGTGVFVDNGPLTQLQNAQTQMGEAGQKLLETVGEQFKQAERVNQTFDEDNKMADYFFKLRTDATTKPTDQQINYFNTEAKNYLQGMKERVSDPKVLAKVQDYWLSHSQSGLYFVQDNQRKNVIQDGIAKLSQGDQVFTSQIDSWASNPAIVEQELSKRFGAYDEAAKSGFITTAQAQKYKEELGNQTDYTRALIQMRDDPYQAQEDIGKHDVYRNLTSQTREMLLERTDSKIKQDEAQARAEAREARMMRMAEYGLVKQDISDALKVYDERGAKPAQWDALLAQAKSYGDLDKGRVFNRMMSTEKDAATTIDFKGLSYRDMGNQITHDVDLINSGKATTDDIRQYERKISIYNDMTNSIQSGNQLNYIAKYHLAPVEQLNPYDQNSIDTRINQVQRAKDQMGGNPNFFTDKEVGIFTRAFNEGSTKDQETLGNMFNRLAGNDPTKMARIFKQLSIKDTSIADEAMFRAEGDNYSAEMMNSGRRKRENGIAKNGDKLAITLSKALDDMNISNFDESGSIRKQMLTGLSDMYYGLAKETGDFTDGVNTSLTDKAMERYFGGRLVTLNGGKIPPFAPGQSDYDHMTLWNLITPDILKQGSLTGEMPQVRMGTTSTPLDFREMITKGRLVPYGAGYAVAYPNAAEKLNGFPEIVVTNKDGSPYIIDMKKIVPSLLSRRQDMTKRAMESFDKEMGLQ